MTKKILAIILATVMMAAVATSCAQSPATTGSTGGTDGTTAAGSTTTAAQTEPKEDYVIEYLIPGAKDTKSLENDVGKEIYEKFGIQINVVGYAGDWEEKCAQMLAGGDYTDMLQLQSSTMVKKYINAGALLDIGALAEQYAPNFLEFYKDSIPYWKLNSEDGKLYNWTANTPDVEHATTPRFDMIIRSDVLEQQGWPEVLDEDSFVNLLKQGLKDNPTTDGNDTLGMVAGAQEDWVLGDTMMQFASKGRYPEYTSPAAWDTETEKFVDGIQDVPAWKSGVKFWNTLYREGILDPECFTDTDAVATEKLNSGRALATVYVTWNMDAVNNNLKSLGKENMQYVTMPIMLKEQQTTGQKRIIPIIDNYDYQSIVITKNAKHPERIMELLNWVATEEGQALLGWGVEDKHYTVKDGLRSVTQSYLDCVNGVSDDKTFNDGVGTYYFLGLSAGYDKNQQVYNVNFDESVKNLAMSDRLKAVYSHYGWKTVTDPWKNNKNFKYEMVHSGLYSSVSLEPGSDVETTATKLKEYKMKQLVPLIIAESEGEFESLWAQFIEGYKALNPDSVVKAYNDLYSQLKTKFDSNAK